MYTHTRRDEKLRKTYYNLNLIEIYIYFNRKEGGKLLIFMIFPIENKQKSNNN